MSTSTESTTTRCAGASRARERRDPAPPESLGGSRRPTSKRRPSARCSASLSLICLLGTGCSRPVTIDSAAGTGQSWSVTAWGQDYEVFPEVDALIAGRSASAHTHVTRLSDFSPVAQATVEILLEGPAGSQSFRSDQPSSPGIFEIEITPEVEGEFDLVFRITPPSDGNEGIVDRSGTDSNGDSTGETIRGGRVRVGSSSSPGGIVVAPAPRGARDGGEPLPFLKEEQWRSDFATGWVRRGTLRASEVGVVRVRPPAGGETTLTAPLSGVLHAASGQSWPYPGQRIRSSRSIVRITPHHAASRASLAALEATLATIETERVTAESRLARLEQLLALEATSVREVEEARSRLDTLTTRRDAAERDLEATRAARSGAVSTDALTVRAPFPGEVAEVFATPGTTVEVGDPIARLVRTDRRWLEFAVSPRSARRLREQGLAGVVLQDPESGPSTIDDGFRLVSISPELSSRTDTVLAIVEVPPSDRLLLGSSMTGRLLLGQEQEGIVVPDTAVIDDGGVSVVYLQLSGERFARQQISVLERQADRLLVTDLTPGQRLVSRGGEAIRRSSLMTSGQAHGHVH